MFLSLSLGNGQTDSFRTTQNTILLIQASGKLFGGNFLGQHSKVRQDMRQVGPEWQTLYSRCDRNKEKTQKMCCIFIVVKCR